MSSPRFVLMHDAAAAIAHHYGWGMHTPTITGLRPPRRDPPCRSTAIPLVAHARRDEKLRGARGARRRPACAGAWPASSTGSATVALIYGRLPSRPCHGQPLVRMLRALGAEALARAVPAGEQTKSLATAVEMWNWLAHTGLGRRDLVVTFGGGVINDLGGFVASAYMRGVPYVNVPTTLLAKVDGAIGGKVAVNHPWGRTCSARSTTRPAPSPTALPRMLDRRHLAAGSPRRQERCDRRARALHLHRGRADALLARRSGALERARARGGGDQVRADRAGPVRGRSATPAQLRPHRRPSARDRDGLRPAAPRRGRLVRHGRRGPGLGRARLASRVDARSAARRVSSLRAAGDGGRATGAGDAPMRSSPPPRRSG